jgi:hypothetical protein
VDFSDEVIEAMATLPGVCEQVHLPLQVGDDTLLHRMHRGYTLDEYRTIVRKLRAAMPDIVITTDLMLGFPGETREQVENTYRVVEEIRFRFGLHVRLFAPRPHQAAKLPDQIEQREKTRRLEKLIEIQNAITVEINKSQAGRTLRCWSRGAATRIPTCGRVRRAAARPFTSPPAASWLASSSACARPKATCGASRPNSCKDRPNSYQGTPRTGCPAIPRAARLPYVTLTRSTHPMMTTATAPDKPVAPPAATTTKEMRDGLRAIWAQWLPLAVSFELMMLEGPAVQGAMGRLPDAPLHLAAWGLTMSLSLLIESPVIMLLATAIALVKDAPSYRALAAFTVRLALGGTLLTALLAFTPLFDLVTGQVMGQPAAIAQAARPALQIMLLWTAAIAWRRFQQGVLVRCGQTRLVSRGTLIRLAAACRCAGNARLEPRAAGAQVAAWAIIAAVLVEALATTLLARPVLRRHGLLTPAAVNTAEPPLTQRDIWRFHAPLAATTLLTLLAQPLTSAALARLPAPRATLAAWPVVFLILLVMRGWCFALQEITVARAKQQTAARRTCLALAAAPVHPARGRRDHAANGTRRVFAAAGLVLGRAIALPLPLWPLVRTGLGIGVLLPLVTALGSHVRGRLVAWARRTACTGEWRSTWRRTSACSPWALGCGCRACGSPRARLPLPPLPSSPICHGRQRRRGETGRGDGCRMGRRLFPDGTKPDALVKCVGPASVRVSLGVDR